MAGKEEETEGTQGREGGVRVGKSERERACGMEQEEWKGERREERAER